MSKVKIFFIVNNFTNISIEHLKNIKISSEQTIYFKGKDKMPPFWKKGFKEKILKIGKILNRAYGGPLYQKSKFLSF